MLMNTWRLSIVLLLIAVTGLSQPAEQEEFVSKLIAAALERTNHEVTYDGSYRRIAYPGGDVPDNVGVCTDMVIRSYRVVGIDLQKRVHEDMSKAFSEYPQTWGHEKPDPNIDHRRVPNLQTFLQRRGVKIPASENPDDYLPGDLVTWQLPRNLTHIGIVSDQRSKDGKRRLILHNIGRGPKIDDILFEYPITGHYRYDGSRQ